jgi:hypothetical protein
MTTLAFQRKSIQVLVFFICPAARALKKPIRQLPKTEKTYKNNSQIRKQYFPQKGNIAFLLCVLYMKKLKKSLFFDFWEEVAPLK